jgi:hypothetical protein
MEKGGRHTWGAYVCHESRNLRMQGEFEVPLRHRLMNVGTLVESANTWFSSYPGELCTE